MGKGQGSPVQQPRHLIAFYIDNSDDIIVARVFHERQMLSQHLVEPVGGGFLFPT